MNPLPMHEEVKPGEWRGIWARTAPQMAVFRARLSLRWERVVEEYRKNKRKKR